MISFPQPAALALLPRCESQAPSRPFRFARECLSSAKATTGPNAIELRPFSAPLIETALSVNALAEHFQMSWPAVSQHLRILLDAGLVIEQRHGRERRDRLVPAQLRPVRDWMARDERFWDEHLQRVEKHLTKWEG